MAKGKGKSVPLSIQAWEAWCKHMRVTKPEEFHHRTPDWSVLKDLKSRDPEGYKEFTDAWKAAAVTGQAQPQPPLAQVAAPVAVRTPLQEATARRLAAEKVFDVARRLLEDAIAAVEAATNLLLVAHDLEEKAR